MADHQLVCRALGGLRPARATTCLRGISSVTLALNRNRIMPTALPSDAAERYNLYPNATSAYNVCREFERLATEKNNVRDVMHARILGYLIIYSPSITAQHEIVNVIHSRYNDHAVLSALGSTFLDYYIRPCERSAQTLRITR
jgi:hypothetical protein